MPTTKSPSPANSNYDFALRHERVKLFARVLKQFDANIARTTQAMREVASCLSLVGQSYHEVALCVNHTNPHSAANRAYHISFNHRMVENYGEALQDAATIFSAEMKSIKEGEQYVKYNGGVHAAVLTRLHDVHDKARKAAALGDDVSVAHKKAIASQKVVHKKEAKYARKGRPLTESKLYERQREKLRQHEQVYQAKLRTFDADYEALMQRQLYVAGHTMDEFLDVNTVYMSHMLKVLGCLAPHGAEAIEQMVANGETLGQRLGVASEEQLGSRLRTRAAHLPIAERVATPAKFSRSSSAHNFTGYYENRRQTAPSADRAPPTARALDDGGGAGERVQDAGATPAGTSPRQQQQQRMIAYQTPPRATFGAAGHVNATSRAYSAEEPDPSPPPQAPSFPVAVRRSDAAPGQCVNPLAFGRTVSSDGRGVAPAQGRDAPRSGTGETATTPSITTYTARERSPRHAPFGDGYTPGGVTPPSCAAVYTFDPARPPPSSPPPPPAAAAGAAATRLSAGGCALGQRPSGRGAAVAAPLGVAGLDRARSSEPFVDDDLLLLRRSSGDATPRLSLQPLVLFPQDASEDRSPRFATPRMSGATTVGADAVTQQHPRRGSKKPKSSAGSSGSSGGAAAAAATVVAAVGNRRSGQMQRECVASAPPEDETMTCSTTSGWCEASEGSVNEGRATHGHRPLQHPLPHHRAPPPQRRGPTQRPQRHTAPANLALLPTAAAAAAGAQQWCGDGIDSDAGAATGRSYNLSTSYGLDSPVPTPQPYALDARAWEDSQVRPSSTS
ncbi:hypothetical protein NESM_000347100 [Novymonas esmeraldas]|uniref:Uncharacterized protein n=1 Tax=Novymonas esmeraldas TaxID=1808958 RepID=A0AAW0EJL2_9TRYP